MKRLVDCLGPCLVLVGCGSSAGSHPQVDASGSPSDATGTDTSNSGFMLTSTAFAQGAAIPTISSCSGVDTSPPLTWVGAPSGAKSFALTMIDQTRMPPLDHWVVFDIPGTATALPASVENVFAPANAPGAHQTLSQASAPAGGQPRGYAGPCPPVGGGAHTYQFALYVIDAAALSGGAAMTSPQEAVAAILLHKVGDPATLSGTFSR